MSKTVVLAVAGARAVVDVQRGGRLASIEIGGRELLVAAPDATDRSMAWGSFLMAPWPGRLADGRLAWAGGSIQLPRNHGRHAIHGFVFDRPWEVERGDSNSCELEIELDRRWPFGGRVRQRFELAPGRLLMLAEVHADAPMPAAIGWHPWFRRVQGEPVRIRLAANRILERRGMIPTGRTNPVAGRTDLRAGPPLGSRRIDDAYVDVSAPPVIEWPDLRLTLDIAPPLSVVTVFTPPGAFCVEPQTAWPNALGPGASAKAGAALVEPGLPLRAEWSMHWDRALHASVSGRVARSR